MVRRVLVTRPTEAFAALAEELAAHGIEALAAPMLTVDPLTPSEPGPDGLQAILLTSGNGAEGAARLTARRGLPVLAVGDATAEAARQAGFTAVETAAGAGEDLVALVAERCRIGGGPLLWASGEAISTDLEALLTDRGFTVARRVVYRTVTAERLPDAVAEALRSDGVEGALFFSPRSASAFATLAVGAGLDGPCGRVTAYCMSDAIAQAASTLTWRAIHVARHPTRSALIALIVDGESDPLGSARRSGRTSTGD